MAITIPHTFVPNTVILSAQVNANFTALSVGAVNKAGDTMTGALNATALAASGNLTANTAQFASTVTFNGIALFNGGTSGLSGSLAGNASTATALATPRTIAGVSFDGTANIAIASTGLSDSANLIRINAVNSAASAAAGAITTTIRNTTATGSTALLVGNDVGNASGLYYYGSSHATLPSQFHFISDGRIGFHTLSTLRGTMFVSGGFSWGDTTDPGATNFRVAGTVVVGTSALGSLTVGSGTFQAALTNGVGTEGQLYLYHDSASVAAGGKIFYRNNLGNNQVTIAYGPLSNSLSFAGIPGGSALSLFFSSPPLLQAGGDLRVNGTSVLFAAFTAVTRVAGDRYLVIDASGNIHVSAIGPAS